MTQVSAFGLPVIALQVGFILIAATPVWFGAKVTGAGRPTLIMSVLALLLGTAGSILGLIFGGVAALIIAPLAFLLSFKFVLDMSFGGAFLLCIITVAGYFLMAKFIGGGVSFNKDAEEATAWVERGAVAMQAQALEPLRLS